MNARKLLSLSLLILPGALLAQAAFFSASLVDGKGNAKAGYVKMQDNKIVLTENPVISHYNSASKTGEYYFNDSLYYKASLDSSNETLLPIALYPEIVIDGASFDRLLVLKAQQSVPRFTYLNRIAKGRIALYSDNNEGKTTYYMYNQTRAISVNFLEFGKQFAEYTGDTTTQNIPKKIETPEQLIQFIEEYNLSKK